MHILECIFWNACFGMHISELLLWIQNGSCKHKSGLARATLRLISSEIKMKRLESPPSGHFMIVARVPVAPPTIRRHIVSKTKPML